MNGHAAIYFLDDDSAFVTSQAPTLSASGMDVHSFASARQFLEAVASDSRGCVLADLAMPELSVLDLQGELAIRGVSLPIVYFTRAVQQNLREVVQRALDHATMAQEERAKALEVRRRFATLTGREREVVRQVLDGQLNKEIAAALGITTRTVKLHRTSIRKKLGIRSVVQLATLAYDARLFEPTPSVVATTQRAYGP